MSGNEIFLDTNICIYLLNGNHVLPEFLQGQKIFISIISEIELYAYNKNHLESKMILDDFIQSTNIINIDNEIKNTTIEIRKNYKLKLPDSIIAASAISNALPFLTADKAFKIIKGLDLILYQI